MTLLNNEYESKLPAPDLPSLTIKCFKLNKKKMFWERDPMHHKLGGFQLRSSKQSFPSRCQEELHGGMEQVPVNNLNPATFPRKEINSPPVPTGLENGGKLCKKGTKILLAEHGGL